MKLSEKDNWNQANLPNLFEMSMMKFILYVENSCILIMFKEPLVRSYISISSNITFYEGWLWKYYYATYSL